MKKKICFIISNLNIGGAELTLLKVVQGLKSEFDFTVVSLTKNGPVGVSLSQIGINVIILKWENKFSFFYNLFKLYKILKILKPDIVHTWMYHSDFFGGIIAKFTGVKLIYWNIRNTELKNGVALSTRIIAFLNSFFSYFIPSKIVIVSNSSKKYHLSIGYCKSKMLVIPNGYDLNLFVQDYTKRISFRNNYSFSDSTIIVGSVGRFNKYKDHFTFIKSAIMTLDNISNKIDLRFVLIGRDITESNIAIYDLIKNSKYSDKFYLLGEKANIIDYYSSFDIFCLHSISEGFPNVLAEAMASSLPCISTDVGDAKFILQNDTFIAPPKDIFRLSSILLELIKTSDNSRKLIGISNRIQIESNYSTTIFLKNYKYLYN